MRVHVLRNPTAGARGSQQRVHVLLNELRTLGHQIDDVTGESSIESSSNLQRAVERDEIERLLVSGGDGLVHLAAQQVAETSIPVVLDPSGTGNDFATALGVRSATPATLDAPATPVDLIRATGPDLSTTWIASIAIAGFPASINARANRLRLPLGAQIYAVAAALELPAFSRTTVALRLDGYPIEVDSAMLAIGNTALFGGGMLACPDASATDGMLHLTSINDVGRMGILRHLVGRAGGTADRPEVLRRTATRIDIDTPGVDVWGDGERVGVGPIAFEIVPRAIHIVGVDERPVTGFDDA